MALPLAQACADLPVQWLKPAAELQVPVHGVRHDSRQVEAGDLFVAWRGERFDGRSYAAQAAAAGAVAVLADGPPLAEAPAVPEELPWAVTADPRRLMGEVAARVYGQPCGDLVTVGVTGTNGKTTVVFLVEKLLEEAGLPCGLLGTIGYRFGERALGAGRTTPEGSDLHRLLATMREAGARAVAMEASSHALDQGRVDAMRYDVAVFTNLTRDHLDYHEDFTSYYGAKRRLFDLVKTNGGAVVGVDDAWGARLAEELRPPQGGGPHRVLTFAGGVEGVESAGEGADVSARRVEFDLRGLRGTLRTPRGDLDFETPLVGHYNLLNVLATVAIAEVLELEHATVQRALAGAQVVPGRLDPVLAGQHFPVLVDFAHTDGALVAALESMRSLWPGKIVVVFGCGGEKDRGKRPLMGEAAGRLADLAIATSDNPRGEAPEAILAAVEEGLRRSGGAFRLEADRRLAIDQAVALAASDSGDGRAEETWAVLVAGKGHERDQIIGGQRLPFDDREELEAAVARHVTDSTAASAAASREAAQ